ncbi:Conserved_hypothetical protein [Hexamita inflata]|uniref:SUN domain-containing protein n=1 Tax=Hexamita inflata TaxID=28002 RepID=A0AA86NFS2_9EUKA|nr:Conserved hypothetical protein [Hexamita inflata]
MNASANEDPEYFNRILNELDDLQRSYLTRDTEQSIKTSAQNLQKGYESVRTYLIQRAEPPRPAGGPDIQPLQPGQMLPLDPLNRPESESEVPMLGEFKITRPNMDDVYTKEQLKQMNAEKKAMEQTRKLEQTKLMNEEKQKQKEEAARLKQEAALLKTQTQERLAAEAAQRKLESSLLKTQTEEAKKLAKQQKLEAEAARKAEIEAEKQKKKLEELELAKLQGDQKTVYEAELKLKKEEEARLKKEQELEKNRLKKEQKELEAAEKKKKQEEKMLKDKEAKEERDKAKKEADEAKRQKKLEAEQLRKTQKEEKENLKRTQNVEVRKEPTGPVGKFLVEISDFSEYLRFKASKKNFCYNWCILVLLSLIAAMTGLTAYFIYSCCFKSGMPATGTSTHTVTNEVDPKIFKQLFEDLKSIKLSIKEKHDSKLEPLVDQIKHLQHKVEELSKKIPEAHAPEINYGEIQARIETLLKQLKPEGHTAANIDTSDITAKLNQIENQLSSILENTQIKHDNEYQEVFDLFDKFDIINRPTNRSKLIHKLNSMSLRKSNPIDNIFKQRKRFYQGQCYVPPESQPQFTVEAEPFKAKYLVVGHPLETDSTAIGRKFAPQFITITIKYKSSQTEISTMTLQKVEFKIDGPMFQVYSFQELGISEFDIISMTLDFEAQDGGKKLCIYEVIVLGEYVQ